MLENCRVANIPSPLLEMKEHRSPESEIKKGYLKYFFLAFQSASAMEVWQTRHRKNAFRNLYTLAYETKMPKRVCSH